MRIWGNARILVTYPPKRVYLFESWLSNVKYHQILRVCLIQISLNIFLVCGPWPLYYISLITTASCFCYVMCPRDHNLVSTHFTTQLFITSSSRLHYVICKRDQNRINTLKTNWNRAISMNFRLDGLTSWPRFGPFPQIPIGCFVNTFLGK